MDAFRWVVLTGCRDHFAREQCVFFLASPVLIFMLRHCLYRCYRSCETVIFATLLSQLYYESKSTVEISYTGMRLCHTVVLRIDSAGGKLKSSDVMIINALPDSDVLGGTLYTHPSSPEWR
jgi:hypothetical protein